jgi:SecD/SecF fusion protein
VRRNHLILLVITALLGAVAALAVARSPVLGLDLQGGLEIVLKAKPLPGQQVTQDALNQSKEVIRRRVDKLGVSEPDIRTEGSNEIVIDLAGEHDPARAAALIGKTAQVQFFDLEGDAVAPTLATDGVTINPSPSLYSLLRPLQAQAQDTKKNGQPFQWWAFVSTKNKAGKSFKQQLAGPEATKAELLNDLPEGKLPAGGEILAAPGNRIVLTCGGANTQSIFCPTARGDIPAPTNQKGYYLFRFQPTNPDHPVPELTGSDLNSGRTRQDYGQDGRPIVSMTFSGKGGSKFHDITRTLAQRGLLKTQELGSSQPLYQHFTIALDGEIITSPIINFNDLPDGISGNQAQIENIGLQEAKDVAFVLQSGALPLKFVQVARTDVSATLGKDSLHQAIIAGIGGIIAVGLLLLLIYRFLGLVAITGLLIYGGLLYGALLLFKVTLTLPGFAGLILTIGVAADANVVIFERIKEEVRAGKSVRASISAGYRKGFSTIVDANVVTMITAFILFAVATAGVKGFALMLLIGTLLSMFTAVAATRALLGVLSNFRWFDNPSFMGATAQAIPAWQRIDVNSRKRRRIWLSVATALIVLSIISLAVKGLNLGIDFKGGSQINFKTPQAMSVDRVRNVAGTVVDKGSVIQGRGPSSGGRYKEFQIRTKSLTSSAQNELQRLLANRLNADSVGITNVSSSFSGQILRSAILAICVSFVLITLYITFRFQWRFAIPILRTFANDILITLGVYSLSGREVTTSTVAAVLTVLGYSIYDTIIVFDRIRENIPLMRKSSFVAIANQSVWETIRRSIATTVMTLLPIVSLLLFGGATLKDFAFALLVGIGLGAISTIFVATPFLTILMERTPEYAKLTGEIVPEEKKGLGPPPEPAPVRRGRARGLVGALASAGTSRGDRAEPDTELKPQDEPDAVVEAPEPIEADESADAVPEAPAAELPKADAAARREERRRRRRTRPHGRAR